MNYPAAVARFTKLLGIHVPLVSAPMAGASGGLLAAQVTNGGGFGFLSQAHIDELPLARSLLHPSVSDGNTLPIGVGYLGYLLDKLPLQESQSILNTALASNVQAHWFAFGNDLGRWIKFVRENNPQDRNPLIFVQVNSLEEAVRAIEEYRADVIVAQGIESGGHGGSYAPPLADLLQSILAHFAGSGQEPHVLAAGGLANGADVASQIARGASGAVMGTRFLLTPESKYTDGQREALMAARTEDTIRTMAFDYARGTTDWPKGVDGRGLQNDTVSDFEQGVDLELIQSKFKEGIRNQDRRRFLVWAGTGVGSMNRVVPAKKLIQDLDQELQQYLSKV